MILSVDLLSSLDLMSVLMVRWLLRKGTTRSHSELGRETLLRQWYFSLSCGRVGHCRTFYILSIFTPYFYLPFFTSYLSYRPLPPCGLFFIPFYYFAFIFSNFYTSIKYHTLYYFFIIIFFMKLLLSAIFSSLR